ncbi:dehydrogenase [Hyaloraphidium curvatum]|nr:dehydrogenase [Hyaloraphidium curvatum]
MSSSLVPGRFAGKLCIVTGAGSGIGRASALRLAREGARVVATDVSEDRLGQLRASEPSLKLDTVVGDVTADATVRRVLEAAGGPVDGLLNNAGIMDGFLPPAEVDDKTWERVMAVNVTAPMRFIRAVLPGMISAGRGSIVNVSSEASIKTCAGIAYTASKHAINGITKNTAFFYRAQGIRCNAVAPGGVKTNIEAPFLSKHAGEALGPVLQATAGRLAEPEEVAALVAYLLSDDSGNVSGAVIPCDNGWSTV